MTGSTIAYERLVSLSGATNFRDLGGYESEAGARVRWRRVFRSDAQHDLTSADVDAVLALGVADVFDLRMAREVEHFGASPLIERGVRRYHTPLAQLITRPRDPVAPERTTSFALDTEEQQAEHYLEMLEEGKPTVARILAHVAGGPDDAVVFHCTGGRDRTGLTAALLLSALGVPRSQIVHDYGLTDQFVRFSEARLERMRELWGVGMSGGTPPTRSGVMLLTLAALDERYGSPEGYLDAAGVTNDVREALRRQLLEW